MDGAMVNGDSLNSYGVVRDSKLTERQFENDVEKFLEQAGWTTFKNNSVAQVDYSKK